MDPLAYEILEKAKTIAVLGAHWKREKAAFYVPEYLHERDYKIVAVNPVYTDRELWGRPVLASLADIEEPVDAVDVFRRAEHLTAHVPEILAMDPLPTYVWFQLGIVNDAAASALEAEGIKVVQDRCMLADHRAWF